MSDNLIPFRRRGEQPAAQPAPEAQAIKAATPPASLDAGSGDEHAEWTMVQIVAKAPPTSR